MTVGDAMMFEDAMMFGGRDDVLKTPARQPGRGQIHSGSSIVGLTHMGRSLRVLHGVAALRRRPEAMCTRR